MLVKSFLLLSIMFCMCMISCKKKTNLKEAPNIEPSDLRVGLYKGMFQECGPLICYDKDTTFQIIEEDNIYYLLFGNHKDEIRYSSPIALEFYGIEYYALDSSGNNYASVLSGYCRNDSVFVKFSNGWGVYNNNLLSGKKQ